MATMKRQTTKQRAAGMRRMNLEAGGVRAEKQRTKDQSLERAREMARILRAIRERE